MKVMKYKTAIGERKDELTHLILAKNVFDGMFKRRGQNKIWHSVFGRTHPEEWLVSLRFHNLHVIVKNLDNQIVHYGFFSFIVLLFC